MRVLVQQSPIGSVICLAAVALLGCSNAKSTADSAPESAKDPSQTFAAQTAAGSPIGYVNGVYRGLDRNDYPGDSAMYGLHKTFAFTGYWLTNPPGATSNSWIGKRLTLKQQGWGFLVLANGRLDAEILKSQKSKVAAADLGRKDAAVAVAAAQREGFAAHTTIFLDQEEGGRLLDEQAAYLLAWTQAVAASHYFPGVYASGQPVEDSPGKTITTIADIRSRVAAGHLHPIAMFDAQDACPPSPGCTLQAKPLSDSSEPVLSRGGDLIAWQYSQSPRRPDITRSCANTYAPDGNCYAPGFPTIFLDMDSASSPDPSHGR
jgi:hypothetical protein